MTSNFPTNYGNYARDEYKRQYCQVWMGTLVNNSHRSYLIELER